MFKRASRTGLHGLFVNEPFDDATHALHTPVTSTGLIGAAILISTSMFCIIMRQWNSIEAWEEDIEAYCFGVSKFYVPANSTVSPSLIDKTYYKYYSWVPCALCAHALMLWLPKLLWLALVGRPIGDNHLAKRLDGLIGAHPQDKNFIIEKIVASATYFLPGFQDKKWWSWFSERRITMGLLLVKCVYLANVGVQFCFVAYFLDIDFLSWGWKMIAETFATGHTPHSLSVFPDMAYCDYQISDLFEPLMHSAIRCSLTANAVYKMLYLTLWAWFALLAVVSCLDLLHFVVVQFVPSIRNEWMLQTLKKVPHARDREAELREFCRLGLGSDGAIFLGAIQTYAGPMATETVAAALFKAWQISGNHSKYTSNGTAPNSTALNGTAPNGIAIGLPTSSTNQAP